MDLTFAPTSLDEPKLVQMVKDYYEAYHSPLQQFKPPAQWVGAFEGDVFLAAIGFTRSPDSSIVFVAELVCLRTLRGAKALKRLVDNFQTYCTEHPGIQLVVAQCLTANKTMHKFLETKTFMRPVSTVFACAKSDLAVENDNGRRITRL